MNLQMVNLHDQYLKIKNEIDQAILDVVNSTMFIKGPVVKQFEENLAEYLGAKHVIGCANGTDALQVAMMALDLQPGDEVIVPAFTYVATAEVIALLGLVPIMVDVDIDTFNIDIQQIEDKITPKTKAIVPVHLFGQNSDMEAILKIANKYSLFVIEDAAQSIGSDYIFSDGTRKKSGTMGHIGCTSFFPSKNLGCFGDGGAIFTNDDELAGKIKMVANHGQSVRYYHDVIGVNSRLDAIQAAVLDVKLKYLDDYAKARNTAADIYDKLIEEIPGITCPVRAENSNHVFHQYTLKAAPEHRSEILQKLKNNNIPHNIYYPVPLYQQKAFEKFSEGISLENTEKLCASVFSLPMHTELTEEEQDYIVSHLKS